MHLNNRFDEILRFRLLCSQAVLFYSQINQWCSEAGGDITFKNIVKDEKGGATRVDDSNPFWKAFKEGINQT